MTTESRSPTFGRLRHSRLNLFVSLTGAGFFLALAFHLVKALVFHRPFPDNTFLTSPTPQFGDFYSVVDLWLVDRFNGIGFGLSYFPSLYLIAHVISLGGRNLALGLFLGGLFGFCAWYGSINLRSQTWVRTAINVLFGLLLTYPLLFIADTGNFEAFVFIFLALFLFFYQRGSFHLAVFFLAYAISMKAFPGVFLILLFADKRFRLLAETFGWIAFLSLLPLALFRGGWLHGPNQYFANLHASQKLYADLMILTNAGNNFGHSLLNGVRLLFPSLIPDMHPVILPYAAFALVVFAATGFVIVKRERSLWRRVLMLVILMDLLPFTSTDYKLIHFLLPAYLLINEPTEQSRERWVLAALAVLVVPKAYGFVHGTPPATWGAVIAPSLMIILLLWLLTTSMNQKRAIDQEAAER